MKTSKKRQENPKCPQCGNNLTTSEADPSGRPMCESRACGYVGAATKTPAPAVWGPREDAHIAAIEKWLSKPHEADDFNIALAITTEKGFSFRAKAFGYPGLAFKPGLELLEVGKRFHRMKVIEKQSVKRDGCDIVFDKQQPLDGKEVLRIVTKDKNGLFIAAVRSEYRDGEDLIETFRRMANRDLQSITAKVPTATAWIGKKQAKEAGLENKKTPLSYDRKKTYVDKWAETLKKRYHRATGKSGA